MAMTPATTDAQVSLMSLTLPRGQGDSGSTSLSVGLLTIRELNLSGYLLNPVTRGACQALSTLTRNAPLEGLFGWPPGFNRRQVNGHGFVVRTTRASLPSGRVGSDINRHAPRILRD